jgi:hypothetical protein
MDAVTAGNGIERSIRPRRFARCCAPLLPGAGRGRYAEGTSAVYEIWQASPQGYRRVFIARKNSPARPRQPTPPAEQHERCALRRVTAGIDTTERGVLFPVPALPPTNMLDTIDQSAQPNDRLSRTRQRQALPVDYGGVASLSPEVCTLLKRGRWACAASS